MSKTITIGRLKKYITIVDNNFILPSDGQWYGMVRNSGVYIKSDKYGYLHRYIMGVADSKVIIDHANMNTLDNTKDNLRICSIKENVRNRNKQKNNTSGYKGVYKRRDRKLRPYNAFIHVNRKKINLGTFDNPNDAAKAYNKAAVNYHGEFARLNIIERTKK